MSTKPVAGKSAAPARGARTRLSATRRVLRDVFLHLEVSFDRIFGARNNPFHHLGALGYFFYWIVAVTGIYLYILFDTSLAGAYSSIEHLTHAQWYLGGVMRSLHRYASDALVVVMVLHMAREFALDRYHGMRWFAWFTGVPILWLVSAAGIGGYWLVWDRLAQYIAVMTMEWLDWLPIFGESLARNFLTVGSLGDRFFSLLVFLHIGVPLFLLFAMWIHLMRIARADVNPPRALAAGTMLTLLAVSLAKPALSQGPADLSTVVASVGLDWFYLALYPLFDLWSAGWIWLLVAGATLLIAIMPWLPRRRDPPPAVVDLANCNGCARCFADCPYGAVIMQPRSDGRPFEREAMVNAALCTACGICAGACPTSTPFRRASDLVPGIDLVDLPLRELRARIHALAPGLKESAGGGPRVLVFGCDAGVPLGATRSAGVAALSLPCVAMLPPSFIDYVLHRGVADGVMLAGCAEGACFHRLGIDWTEARLARTRDPYLRARVPRERIALCWAGAIGEKRLAAELAAFRERLAALDAGDGDDGATEALRRHG